jgi:hypothetical protein
MVAASDQSRLTRAKGRPKGSGIDDSAELAQVRALLAAEPKLRPTTAIKRLGVTDPSIVRRLRNKLGEGDAPMAVVSSVPTALAEKKSQIEKVSDRPAVASPTMMSEPLAVDRRQAAPPAQLSPKAAQEAELLAAYLEALRASAPVAPSRSMSPDPIASASKQASRPEPPPAKPEPAPREIAEAATRPSAASGPAANANPFAAMMPMGMANFSLPGMPAIPPAMVGFNPFAPLSPFGSGGSAPSTFPSMPGFPSFLQPFMPKPASPQPGTDAFRQLEAFKLAIEVMTAISRLQLHLVQNVAAYSPMALMLQGQAFMGQMLLSSLTGQLDALRPKPGKK